jgi:GDP-4-dehydro-6-deoxy-D-mannose reductase
MRVLVTGSTGFTGRALVAHLREREIDVHRVSVRKGSADVEFSDFRDVSVVTDLLLRVRPTHIMHLSGALSTSDLSSGLAVNALHCAVLLDAVQRSGLDARILVVGSAAEYGPVDDGDLPAREDLPPKPVSAYGCTKLAQTQLALASGLPVLVVRPGNVIGPGMPQTLALGRFSTMLRDIADGKHEPKLHVGDLSAVRDFIDVEDAVRIYWDLMNRPEATGKVVNVGTGVGVRMGVVLSGLVAAFGLDVQIVQDQSSSQRSGTNKAFVAAIDQMQALIGPQTFIPLEQSLERIAAHTRSGGVS